MDRGDQFAAFDEDSVRYLKFNAIVPLSLLGPGARRKNLSFGGAKNFKPAHPEPKLEHKVVQRRFGFGDAGSGSIRSRGLSLSSLQRRFLSKFDSMSRR